MVHYSKRLVSVALKKLNVFGLSVPVRLDNLGPELAGHYDPMKKEIVINNDSTQKFDTMLHELLHACWYRTALSQTDISRDVQEIIVESFAIVLSENFKTLVAAKKYLDNK